MTKKSLVQRLLEGINEKVFFVILFLYQIIFIFQGLDFSDEGFYTTFYQQIFVEPGSVMYNFMYWLTGIVGGAFNLLFPHSGLLGFRFLGVLVTTSTIIIAYNFLKNYVNIYHLRLGIVLILVLISNDPKELNYDNLSMLLFVTSAVFLVRGLQKNARIKLFISGALIGLNCFTRLTNVLGVALVLSIVYNGYINHQKLKYQFKQVLIFGSGFLLCVIFILLLMNVINHFKPFIKSLEIVMNMGTEQGSEHGAMLIIFNAFKKWIWSLFYLLLISGFIMIFLLTKNTLQAKTKYNLERLFIIFKYFLFLLLVYLTVTGKIRWVMLLYIFIGLSLTGTFFILLYHNNKQLKLLSFAGILILLFYPLGSDELVEMFSLWIIFPVALDYFFSVSSIYHKTTIADEHQERSLTLFIHESQMNEVKKIFIYGCLFIGLYFSYFYPYFDVSNRIKMHYSVENKYLKGIFTTKERTTVVNELLNESAKYVKKHDYVFAYDCIPMFHYLTETKPFLYNPWPWAYLPDDFKKNLDKAVLERKVLPVVIIQKLNTLNSNWPQNTYDNYAEWKENKVRNAIMNDFLKGNNYKKIWENKAFEILIP
jgi:hypothetical protein